VSFDVKISLWCLEVTMAVRGEDESRLVIDNKINMFSQPKVNRGYIYKEEETVSVVVVVLFCCAKK
jgi:hypothetical protein